MKKGAGAATDAMTVASMDDAKNVLGGLTYADRVTILDATRRAFLAGEPGFAAIEDHDAYAQWCAIVALQKLIEAKGLRWAGSARRSTTRLGPDFRLVELLPPHALLPANRPEDVPRSWPRLRRQLEERLFSQGLLATNEGLRRVAAQAVLDEEGAPSPTVRRFLRDKMPVRTADGEGQLGHHSLPRLLRHYGIGRPVLWHRQRAYRIRFDRLEKVVELMRMHVTVDLASLSWMRGRFAVSTSSPA